LKTLLPVLVCALAVLRGAPALAQGDGGPDPANVRVRIGPLMMNPTISITNIGIDHNVFNDPPDKQPKEDFTVTVTPATDFWIHLGPTWLTASLNEQINWYQKYASERTANNTYKLGWNASGAVMSFRINGSYLSARERPGFEIDTRAARKETNFDAATDFNFLSKTYIGVTGSRQQTRFAADSVFLDPATGVDVNLETALDRVDWTYGVTLRHQLTPLTSLTVSATRSLAQFDFAPERNTSATGANASLSFAPAALMTGSLNVGFTDFKPDDPALPGYTGFVGSVDLTYVLLGSTRFAATGGRSVQYSYDINQPYYVQSKIGGSIAQQLFGPFDVQVRGDIAFLAYRNRAGVAVEVADRTDRVTTVGVGLGFHMGRDLRLAFNVDQNNRDTQVLEHAYEKFLIGTSLTYGF
jgi:hypothetical protein